MKWHFALLLLSLPFAAQAKVVSATLFPSHAQLVWEESTTIQQGSGELTLSGLPVGLQDPTLLTEIHGLQGIVIQRVQVRQVEQADVVADTTRNLQSELKNVEQRIGVREDEIRAWSQQVTLMTEAAGNPGEVTATDLALLADTVQTTTLEALKQVREIRQAMAEDIAERDRIKRELATTQQNARATKSVSVVYQAERGGKANVRLQYQTGGASWRSQYNARVITEQSDEGALALEHLAVIRQTTGTNWNNIDLTLSTANARLGTDIPPLSPWIVSPGAKTQYREKNALGSMLDSAQFESLSAPQTARVNNDGAFTQSYRVDGPVSIGNGKSEQFITVANYEVPVNIETRLYPAMDLNGFLYATGTFTADIPLPAGEVMLYRDGQSVGRSYLASLAPGSELSIGFGVNDRVTAEVISEQNQKGEQGIFKGEKYARRANRYEITNNHTLPVAVQVFDRLPVSQQDDLTVEALDVSKPVTRDARDIKGALAWLRTIKPGNTITLKAGFEVRVPEDSELPAEFR